MGSIQSKNSISFFVNVYYDMMIELPMFVALEFDITGHYSGWLLLLQYNELSIEILLHLTLDTSVM